MPYVWINPVTESMYEQDVLNVFLEKHGYKRFQVTGNWLTVVREKYGLAVSQTTKTGNIPHSCSTCYKVLRIYLRIF